jgi:cadmium resistance protein CadD (predicted permease)
VYRREACRPVKAGVIAQAAGLFTVTNFDDIVVRSLFFVQGTGQHGATQR